MCSWAREYTVEEISRLESGEWYLCGFSSLWVTYWQVAKPVKTLIPEKCSKITNIFWLYNGATFVQF
jgi:hypothetical protein